jgi:hypothetical protein
MNAGRIRKLEAEAALLKTLEAQAEAKPLPA